MFSTRAQVYKVFALLGALCATTLQSTAEQEWGRAENDYIKLAYLWDPAAPVANELVSLYGSVIAKEQFACSQIETVAASAQMPQHGHGMATQAEATLTGHSFIVQGLYFQMPGEWSVAIDVFCKGRVRRIEWELSVN
ncbi:hypothetical protein [Mesorhizobium sp.]|uniref:hypothetical protein n=1 Tax=Mesorhizobium sp. TaxID=1871066 RepID=UPI000FE6CC62|nr:hypothetical protein [Mesorhizobium sp.]RWP37994.1 MAG: hypothetical protein EOR03_03575 [Mesorhizobium sp.]